MFYFKEKSHGNSFAAYPVETNNIFNNFGNNPRWDENDIEYAQSIGATHFVIVSHNPINDSGWRFAKILKTVAYLAIDEDENGLIWDKWDIKKYN